MVAVATYTVLGKGLRGTLRPPVARHEAERLSDGDLFRVRDSIAAC
jgi:hypothetical protein